MTDRTKLSFFSENNYLKRGFWGSETLTLAGAGAVVTHTVEHNLGYIPFFVVGAELDVAGIIWSNNYVHFLTETNLTGNDIPIQLQFWCDETTLTIRIRNGDGSFTLSGTRNVYWAIYLDYGNV